MKDIYYFLMVSGLIVLLLRWRKVDRRLHLFAPVLFLTIITELVADLKKIYFVYHINQAVDFTALSAYFYLLVKDIRYRRCVVIAWVLYMGYFAAFFIRFPAIFFRYDPVDFVAEGAFITAFSLYYLVALYRGGEQINIAQHPHFWIASGNLLFYSGASLFMGVAFNLMKEYRQLYLDLAVIVKLLNLVLYSVYIKAFLCRLPSKVLA